MAERAPLSVTFYLEPKDAELFAALYALRLGARYDEREHDALIEAGLLEVEEFNPGPNGEDMNDVRLTPKGERQMHLLRKEAFEKFEAKRKATRVAAVPSSPGPDSSRSRSVPVGRIHPVRELPAGRASRPVPEANTHRGSLAPEHEEGA